MPSFRADHVGGFLRPESLIAARRDMTRGRLSQAELWERENEAIHEVVARQESIGLEAITDGG